MCRVNQWLILTGWSEVTKIEKLSKKCFFSQWEAGILTYALFLNLGTDFGHIFEWFWINLITVTNALSCMIHTFCCTDLLPFFYKSVHKLLLQNFFKIWYNLWIINYEAGKAKYNFDLTEISYRGSFIWVKEVEWKICIKMPKF